MEILPGIYQINGSPYGRHQNSYLIHLDGTTILIDSGDLQDGDTLPEVHRNAARWGFRLEQASHMLLTHAHFDHASHAAATQQLGVRIVASPDTADAIAKADDRCLGFAIGRPFSPCTADIVIAGDSITVDTLTFNCIPAPGHTEGMLIFELIQNGERIWFTGDLFEATHAHQDVNLPFTGAPDFDRATYIRTLVHLRTLPPCDHLLPGHGPACIGNAHRLLDMIYDKAKEQWA